MKQKWKKIGCFSVLIYILVIQFSIIGVAAESTVIVGDDPEKDLRLFDGEWLVDEFDDTSWDDLDEGLDEVYNSLDRNWDNSKACDPLYDNTGESYNNPENYKKYTTYCYVDIIQIRVEDLDTTKAKMVVEVNGDAEDADRVWFLFIWSDCGPDDDSDDIVFVGIFIPESLGGGGGAYYEWEQGSDDGNGTVDFDNSGHNIEMEFDSSNWDNVKKCKIKAIMMTTEDEITTGFEDADMVIDIFPGSSGNLCDLWWLWLLLIILIIVITLIILYYYWRKRKQKNSPKIKNRGEGKSYKKWSLVFWEMWLL